MKRIAIRLNCLTNAGSSIEGNIHPNSQLSSKTPQKKDVPAIPRHAIFTL